MVVLALAGENTLLRKGADFAVTGRLGWNEQGVLLQVDVTDTTVVKQPDVARLYEGDCVEFFIMPNDKSAGFPQIVATPGRTKEVPVEIKVRI